MAGNPHSPGATRAATGLVPDATDEAAVTTPGRRPPEQDAASAGEGRRPRALTIVAVVAVALFAVWGIGGPLVGTSLLTPTNEMVAGNPWANAGFGGTDVTNTFLDDTYTSELPSEILFKQELGKGNFAQWNPYASGGSPLGAVPNYAFFSPLTIPFYVLPSWLAPAYERLLEIICAAGATFLFLRRLSVSRPAALAGGLIFASSGFLVAWLGFPQTRVAAFIPVLFWTVERVIQRRRVADAALVAVPIAALLLGGFPAVTGYALLTAVAYVVVRLIALHRHEPRRLIRPMLFLVGSVIAGVGLTLFELVPFLGFFKTWLIEGRGQTGADHLQLASLLTSVAPWAFGSVDPNLGTQFVLRPNMVEAVSFVGAAAMVLALVALAMARKGRTMLPKGVWVFFVAAIAIWAELIYVGGPPLHVLQDTPVLRAVFSINFVARARSVLGFLLAVFAAVGFDLLLRARAEQRVRGRQWVWPAIVTVGGLLVGAVLVYAGLKDVRSGAAQSGQNVAAATAGFRTEVLIASGLIVVAVVCVVLLRDPVGWLTGETGRRRVRFAAATVLIALITAQSTEFVVRYDPHSGRDTFYPVTDTHTFLADHLGDDRFASSITGMVFGTNVAYPLRSVNGHTFINAQFAALVRGIPGNPIGYPTYIDFAPNDFAQASSPVLDRLGAKYFVAATSDAVFGSLHLPPRTGNVTLTPGKPLTIGLPASGPLRAVAVVPDTVVPPGIASNPKAAIDVVIRDAAGRQVAKATRLTAGMRHGGLFEVAVPGEAVPDGTRLTATLTLRAPAPLTIWTGNGGGGPVIGDVTSNPDGLRLVYAGSSVIYQRMNALPRIRWASAADVVPGERQRVALLASGSLPDSTVVLNEPGPATAGRPGAVRVDEDGTDTISTTVNAQGAGYLVVADADQVGWAATVDGAAADLVPADQGLVAVHVPAGRHTVVLHYALPRAHLAAWVSAGVAVVLILLALGDWWLVRRRRSAARAEA
jgi:hypothetical protein